MGVEAGRPQREFAHVKAAEIDGAGGVQPFQHGGGRRRHMAGADFRAAGRDAAFAVVHVLVRERRAMQRAEIFAPRPRRIRAIGGGERAIGLDGDEGVDGTLPRRRAIEAGARQLARGYFAGRQRRRRLDERPFKR
jgi:hypothetical protein